MRNIKIGIHTQTYIDEMLPEILSSHARSRDKREAVRPRPSSCLKITKC